MHLDAVPRLPTGFSCGSMNCGLKPDDEDLALFVSSVPCAAAALFTRNHFAGAPVLVGRELLRDGRLQAVAVNSKYSNAGTGAPGIVDAREMGAAAARALGIGPDLVLMASTGIIGQRLPIDRVVAGLPDLAESLGPDPIAGTRGMMTTDSHPKAVSVQVGEAVITVVGKGSGMIAPMMATMLVFAFTDAELEPSVLHEILEAVAADTVQMLSVDTDTSTSDTCAILANGLAGPVSRKDFTRALRTAFVAMTEMLARDGEGATKLIRVQVVQAANEADAKRVARALVESPLIKTMAHGADPNVGRILMAVGKCVDCSVTPNRLSASIGGVILIEAGVPLEFDDSLARASLAGDPVEFRIDLGLGMAAATAWGCDLTEGYVTENAAYVSS